MPRYQSIPLSRLRPGLLLGAPIYDPNDPKTKLLGAGVAIDETLIDRLRKRGVFTIIASDQDVARINAFQPQGTAKRVPAHRRQASSLSTDLSRQLDSDIQSIGDESLGQEAPFATVDHVGKGSYQLAHMNEACEENEGRVKFVNTVFQELHSSQSASINPLMEVCAQSMEAMLKDIDLFVCLGVNPYSSDYPHRHSLHTATTALGIGLRMQLGEQALKHLALGCLLHDLGMLFIPEHLYLSDRILTEETFAEITTHPVKIFETLEPYLDEVPQSSQVVIYQMHERLDGSGYPRGSPRNLVFTLSVIAAVADTFVATVADRPHRPGLHPYHAIMNLLQDCSDGLVDPDAVRGLLQAVSLYPIGSYYEMNEGRVARVIRSNPTQYDRPVIELWDNPSRHGEPAVVDMRSDLDLHVVRPLTTLP